jgi:hypothetical protein
MLLCGERQRIRKTARATGLSKFASGVYPFEPEYGLTPLPPRVQSIFVSVLPNQPGRNMKMSRIFEALRHAQLVREGKAPADPPAADAVELPDRRRSRRWAMDISVYVYGHGPEKEPFHEEAHTLNVNANGALLLLSVPVYKGQMLLLTNQMTQQEQDCRVVFLGPKHSRTVETGVAFPQPNSEFWQLRASPEDEPAA